MTSTLSPGVATTNAGATLPLVALPQGELLTVNIDQIPMLKDLVAPGIHIQPLRLDPERGEWVFLATMAPGCELPLHYHTGPAQVWTIQGRWMYREYPDQPQIAGSYLYEPGGSVHTFYTPEDGTFHSVFDAVAIKYLTDAAAAAQGLAPVGYIRPGATNVINS